MDEGWVILAALLVVFVCSAALFVLGVIFAYNLWIMAREGAEYFQRENRRARTRAQPGGVYRSERDEIVRDQPGDQ